MIVVSPSEFRLNQRKYFDLAEKERVIVKRGKKLIELKVSFSIKDNIQPMSLDEFYEMIEKSEKDIDNGSFILHEDVKKNIKTWG
jgi:hypothetical protein